MKIFDWRTLFHESALTTDNFVTGAELYDQDWHGMLLTVDRVMTQQELAQTPEWTNILNELEPNTIFYQHIFGVDTMAITAVTPDLIVRIQGILGTIGVDVKSINEAVAALQSKQGDLALLSTTEKGNLVAAINELKGLADTLAANQENFTEIDDSTTATDSTWSSSKVASSISAAIDGIVDGAPGTLDTLNELAAALADSPDAIADINTILGKAVRVDVDQAFTVEEKAKGRQNIGAASEADVAQLAANVGDISTLVTADYTNARDGV